MACCTESVVSVQSKASLCIEFLQVSRLPMFVDLRLKCAPIHSFLFQAEYGVHGEKSQEDPFVLNWANLKNVQNPILLIDLFLLITNVCWILNSLDTHGRFSVNSVENRLATGGVKMHSNFRIPLLYNAWLQFSLSCAGWNVHHKSYIQLPFLNILFK